MTSDAGLISETNSVSEERAKQDAPSSRRRVAGGAGGQDRAGDLRPPSLAPSLSKLKAGRRRRRRPTLRSPGEAKTDPVAGETGKDAAVGQGVAAARRRRAVRRRRRPRRLSRRRRGGARTPGLCDGQAAFPDDRPAGRRRGDRQRPGRARSQGLRDRGRLFEALTPLKGSGRGEGAKASESRDDRRNRRRRRRSRSCRSSSRTIAGRRFWRNQRRRAGRKPLVVAAGLALLALLGAWALYVRQSGGTVAVSRRRGARGARLEQRSSSRRLRSPTSARLQATTGAPRRTISARR